VHAGEAAQLRCQSVVGGEALHREIGVPGEDGLGEPAVLQRDISVGVFADRQPPVALGLVRQHFTEAKQPCGTACLDEDAVEVSMRLGPRVGECHGARIQHWGLCETVVRSQHA